MFIYKITNLINNNIYIGQTVQSNPKMRWYSHLADARGKRKKGYLHNSINKHGPENFHWEVIDQASNLDDLNAKEIEWLAYYKKTNKVYNLREAGGNKKHSAKSLEKMQESQKRAHARRRALGTDTWTRRDGGAMKGKTHPKKGKPGKKWTEEAKIKHSMVCKNRKQRELTPDLRKKLASSKGKTWKLVDGKRVWVEKK